jgi:hypothetical protein
VVPVMWVLFHADLDKGPVGAWIEIDGVRHHLYAPGNEELCERGEEIINLTAKPHRDWQRIAAIMTWRSPYLDIWGRREVSDNTTLVDLARLLAEEMTDFAADNGLPSPDTTTFWDPRR